jgi:hypothetical protein
MNESSPFLVADPLFLNHFVRERSGGPSAPADDYFSGTHFSSITSFASGPGGPCASADDYFPGTHFPSITSFASGPGVRPHPLTIIFPGPTFPQSLRSRAVWGDPSAPADGLFFRDPLFLNHFLMEPQTVGVLLPRRY